MSNYTMTQFKEDFARCHQVTCDAMTNFPWEDKASYAMWCAQTFYYVSHSTRLLALAAATCKLDEGVQHRRYVDHLGEEKGHEKMALNDLKGLGYSIDQLPETPEIALFYQNQYYWINHHGAMPFFGYIVMLEGLAVKVGGDAYKRVVKAHGAGTGAFLKVHAEEDVDHLEKALDQCGMLSSEQLLDVMKNCEQSCLLYTAMLKECKALAPGLKTKKAA